jgi:hypothetical protein
VNSEAFKDHCRTFKQLFGVVVRFFPGSEVGKASRGSAASGSSSLHALSFFTCKNGQCICGVTPASKLKQTMFISFRNICMFQVAYDSLYSDVIHKQFTFHFFPR